MRRYPSDAGLATAGSDQGGDESADGDFGDDFDDFEEGGDDDGDFGEFNDGDFDDGFQEPQTEPTPVLAPTPSAPQPQAQPQQPQPPTFSFPILDFDTLDHSDIPSAIDPYLNALFPPSSPDPLSTLPPSNDSTHPIFLTPRSASLWSQLVAPPPLQPPDWIRSRIRRLFLVSLGVPVDLDEILPATKQKKLVLPSFHLKNSPRTSTDSRSRSRLRNEESNASTTSLDSTTGKPKPKKEKKREGDDGGSGRRRNGPSEPDFDIVAAKQLCTTTDEALGGMTDEELRAHVARLVRLEETAKEVLEYWTKRTDEKIGDREAFEGVIENLVKHARKVRK